MKARKTVYFVRIMEMVVGGEDKLIRSMGPCETLRRAVQTENRAGINLNWDDFYTEIHEVAQDDATGVVTTVVMEHELCGYCGMPDTLGHQCESKLGVGELFR
tara:strand:+ start:223 stop:531 length:309 start_codon:yes stop_codon:yes gene_type:complete